MGTKPARKRSVRGNFEGRPTSYRQEFAEQATKLCELGATDFDLAKFFKVAVQTIHQWRIRVPEFAEAAKVGKYRSDDRAEMSLYHRAIGYSFESEKVFQHQGRIIRAKIIEHVPPDVTAASLWLRNRRPQQWRDRQENVQLDVHMSLAELVNYSYRDDLPALPEPKVIDHEDEPQK